MSPSGDVVEVGRERDLDAAEQLAQPRRPTGLSDSSGSRSFGRPRCAASSSLAPRSRSASIVGSAARIRASSVIRAVLERHVEVDAQEDAPALDVEVVERPHSSFWTMSTQRLE